LWSLERHAPPVPAAYLPMGNKRALARLALDHLHAKAPAPAGVVPLAAGAPFGTLRIDVEGCTLCLACVQVCPTGALLDNPERPTLRFLEDACVQCGLCQNTCPERVITLAPQLSFLPEAKSPRTVKEEEPACCVRCGKQFGTRGTIERVVAKLADRHPMFRDPAQIERMRMCDNCRVASQFESGANPFAAAPRPLAKTTNDYLRERDEAERRGH
jgi:ferredoxin